MSNNTIQIGEETYPLASVFLYSIPQQDDGRTFISIDLHASSDNKITAGLAVNCLSLLEHSSIEEIQDLRLRFSRLENDPRIELGESVITKPGRHIFDLEIAELSLVFGQIRNNRIPVEARGRCFSLVSPEVEFYGRFDAEIT